MKTYPKSAVHLVGAYLCVCFALACQGADPRFKPAYKAAMDALARAGDQDPPQMPTLIEELKLLATDQEISDMAAEVIRSNAPYSDWGVALSLSPGVPVDYSPVLEAIREKWTVIFTPPYGAAASVTSYVIRYGSEEDVKRLMETADKLEKDKPQLTKLIRVTEKFEREQKAFLKKMERRNASQESVVSSPPLHSWFPWIAVFIAVILGGGWLFLRKSK